MTKKPAFSLMEVMVILLIMAVTLAATAPMISKKMSRNVGTAEEPWKFTGSNESISFNGNGRDNLTVFIGTDRLSRRVFNNLITAVNSAPLYLCSYINNGMQIPHISLASRTYNRWQSNGRYYDAQQPQLFNANDNPSIAGYLGFVADNANNYGINNIPAGVGNFPNSISLPYLSSKLPQDDNGNVQRGIVLGNRLRFRGNTVDNGQIGVDQGGGTLEDIIQDKIVIGHDSDIISMIGQNTEDLRDIILIGSDAGIRGSFDTVVGRGIGFTHANRAIVRNTVFINSRRPGLPRFNNNGVNIGNTVFYCVLLSGPDGNDNESNDFANNNNVAPINRVNNIDGISAITGIGRGLFTSGSGHTLIGNMANCGHDTPIINGNNSFYGLLSSFNSVALGSDVIAAGSNCVAIGAGIMAGFPRVNGRVTPEVNDSNRPGRYNTVAIGHGNLLDFNVNAGNAVALGTNPSIHEGPNAGAVHPEFGISIGTDSEVWLPSGISIGQQAVAEGNSGIAIGSNSDDNTHVLGNNSIAIGSAASVIQPNGQRANNAIAIGAGITANANDEIRFGNNNTTFRFGGTSVLFLGDNNQAKATIRRVCQSGCDIRLKNVGEKLASGLEDIKKLEFFNYTYKKDKEKKPHVGVMAQDLQKVFPTSVSEGSDGYLRIRRDEMFYAALNAIKELDAKIIALASELKSFFERVDKLVEKSNFGVQIARNQASLDNLKSESADIEARLARLEEE